MAVISAVFSHFSIECFFLCFESCSTYFKINVREIIITKKALKIHQIRERTHKSRNQIIKAEFFNLCHSILWNYPLPTWSCIESLAQMTDKFIPFQYEQYILKVKVEYESTYWKWKTFPMPPEEFLIFCPIQI